MIIRVMRLAWFSPLPPVKSGVAAYSAEILPALRGTFAIDCFAEHAAADGGGVFDAYEFAWRHRLAPYDLTIYQLGNAPCHDYMWAYLAAHPGLVVLHDARLHHARASALLRPGRIDDYRAEFRFDHPGAVHDFTEYAVQGLGGPIYSFWSMLGTVVKTARLTAVHNARVAIDLAGEHGVPVETLRMGVPASPPDPAGAARVRRDLSIPAGSIVFTAFGKMTAEKRIAPILRAFRELADPNTCLLLVGDASDYATLEGDTAGCDRVRVTGHVPDEAIGAYLSASDVCLCLRWPTALETSAAWLRCLAAGKATVITALAHLADIPTIDAGTWRPSQAARPPVAVAVDLLDEDRSLLAAMERLAGDAALRGELARQGLEYWQRHHTLDAMAADYRRVIQSAAARTAPAVEGLPQHLTEDYTGLARGIARRFGVEVDVLAARP